MAITFVRDHGTIDQGNNITHVFTMGATGAALGDFLVLRTVVPSDTITVTGVVDSKSNTWTHAVTQSGAGNVTTVEMWWTVLTSALVNLDTITTSLSSGIDFGAHVSEWSQVATSPLDQTGGAVSSFGTPWSSGNITTANADDLLLGVTSGGVSTTSISGSSFTEECDVAISSFAGRRLVCQYRIVAATGTYASTGTWSASNAGPCAIASFKATGTAATDLAGASSSPGITMSPFSVTGGRR